MPHALAGGDVIGIAQTGSGKVATDPRKSPQIHRRRACLQSGAITTREYSCRHDVVNEEAAQRRFAVSPPKKCMSSRAARRGCDPMRGSPSSPPPPRAPALGAGGGPRGRRRSRSRCRSSRAYSIWTTRAPAAAACARAARSRSSSRRRASSRCRCAAAAAAAAAALVARVVLSRLVSFSSCVCFRRVGCWFGGRGVLSVESARAGGAS